MSNSAAYNCKLRRAQEAQQVAITGSDKSNWDIACDIWESFFRLPTVSNLTKKLWESSITTEYLRWLDLQKERNNA
jgi:hypothetical protein